MLPISCGAHSSASCGALHGSSFARLPGVTDSVLGALNAITHQLVTVCNDGYINSQSVCELLTKIAERGADVPVTVVLDNARYQRCAWYSAQLSVGHRTSVPPVILAEPQSHRAPLEFVKEKALYSKYYPTFTEFKEAISDVLDHTDSTHEAELNTLLTLNFQTFQKSSATSRVNTAPPPTTCSGHQAAPDVGPHGCKECGENMPDSFFGAASSCTIPAKLETLYLGVAGCNAAPPLFVRVFSHRNQLLGPRLDRSCPPFAAGHWAIACAMPCDLRKARKSPLSRSRSWVAANTPVIHVLATRTLGDAKSPCGVLKRTRQAQTPARQFPRSFPRTETPVST